MEAYETLRCIGRGNYGAAYLVTEARTRERMVVKKVPLTLLSEEEQAAATALEHGLQLQGQRARAFKGTIGNLFPDLFVCPTEFLMLCKIECCFIYSADTEITPPKNRARAVFGDEVRSASSGFSRCARVLHLNFQPIR